MAQPTQCSVGSWAAGRLVSNTGRTPMTCKKQLSGKNGKSYHDRQYKKAIDVHSKKQQQQCEKERKQRKTSKKKKEKQKTKSKEGKYE